MKRCVITDEEKLESLERISAVARRVLTLVNVSAPLPSLRDDLAARAEEPRNRGEDIAARAKRLAERACREALPPELAGIALGNPDLTDAVRAAQSWRGSAYRGLLLRGVPGCGKSLAAACELVASARAGLSVSWHAPGELVAAVLHSYAPDAPRLGKGLVIVDDLGSESRSDVDEALCLLIDRSKARFVMTTNLDKQAFRRKYGERLIDRLNHCADPYTIKGGSLRKRGKFT